MEFCELYAALTSKNWVSLEIGPRWDDGVHFSILKNEALILSGLAYAIDLLWNEISTQSVQQFPELLAKLLHQGMSCYLELTREGSSDIPKH